MFQPPTDYPPELWERIQSLFEKMLDSSDPAAVLAAETDRTVAQAAERLYGNHQKAKAERFLDEPITLVRHLDPENAPAGAPDLDGQVLSHFRILRKLGEGGMGKVYLAEDLTLHRQVALKFLALKPHVDPRGFLERFRREARAAAALKHPNICTVYGVEEFDGQPVIEMEFVEGETLAEKIAQGALPPEEALALTVQIAGALAEAHRKGIVHRDLKPANIMLTQFGVKVLDFGLAKITLAKELGEETPTLTSTVEGAVLGTPYYMSPEQARAEEADGRSDLFSLGVVLYEMATGERPFTGKSSPAVLAAVLKETPVAPSQRKPQLPAALDGVVAKALEKDRELRYQSAEEMGAACEKVLHHLQTPPPPPRPRRRLVPWAATALVLAGAAVIWLTTAHKAHALSATDTILLADFSNSTGDTVFDDSLKEDLSADLTQSPFLSVVPDETVRATLKLMKRSKDAKLDSETTREVCLRAGSKAYIAGAISRIGNQYRIVLQAVTCESTEVMARAEAATDSKEGVIKALGEAGKKLRERLGDSLASVKEFSTPLLQATTGSLDALKAYSEGRKLLLGGDGVGARPLFQHAIELDPKFAMAILSLGLSQEGLNETTQAAENFRKAFDLRDGVSEWEKFAIESRYYRDGLGDLERGRETYAAWAKTYPREPIAINGVGSVETSLGNFDAALEYERQGVRLGARPALLAVAYRALNRLDEARSTLNDWVTKSGMGIDQAVALYEMDFLRNDSAGMAQHAAWAKGKPGFEDQMLFAQAQTAWYTGRAGQARQWIGRAAVLAQQAGEEQSAANDRAQAAVREALLGSFTEARQQAAAALQLSSGRELEAAAALALAMAGDTRQAQSLEADLAGHYPSQTLAQFVYLPQIRGALAIQHKDFTKALDVLQGAAPFELGYQGPYTPQWTPNIYSVYIRGQAYLGAHRWLEAAAEFQKILSHRGLVGNDPVGALARLNLARAYAGQNDAAKAKAAYQDFLVLWKDADPDVPVLKQARNEYQKLK